MQLIFNVTCRNLKEKSRKHFKRKLTPVHRKEFVFSLHTRCGNFVIVLRKRNLV